MSALLCVPPDKVRVLWNAVLPILERAYAAVDEEMPPDMLEGLEGGRLVLWISAPANTILAALVTALLPRPSGKVCKLMVCGGHGMRTWVDGGHDQIEAYARAEGCDKLLADGRPGWSRVLPGYETKRVVLEKRL